ncbi:hypothetical protein GPALN_006594 [Globodera pallida]|nr:hypothetical protein GPALN_006594 [Globodera pallida]
MKFLYLFAINAMLAPYCTALLKCRRENVGTARGVPRTPVFRQKECDRETGGTIWHPDPQHKYCMTTYCTIGNDDWLTVYGCTSTSDRNWCSNQLGINLRKHFAAVVCRNCTLGGENQDYGNMNYPLHDRPPDKTTTTKNVPKMTTTTKNVPKMATTETPFNPILFDDHGTCIKIVLPLVIVSLLISCGTFFGHPFE